MFNSLFVQVSNCTIVFCSTGYLFNSFVQLTWVQLHLFSRLTTGSIPKRARPAPNQKSLPEQRSCQSSRRHIWALEGFNRVCLRRGGCAKELKSEQNAEIGGRGWGSENIHLGCTQRDSVYYTLLLCDSCFAMIHSHFVVVFQPTPTRHF